MIGESGICFWIIRSLNIATMFRQVWLISCQTKLGLVWRRDNRCCRCWGREKLREQRTGRKLRKSCSTLAESTLDSQGQKQQSGQVNRAWFEVLRCEKAGEQVFRSSVRDSGTHHLESHWRVCQVNTLKRTIFTGVLLRMSPISITEYTEYWHFLRYWFDRLVAHVIFVSGAIVVHDVLSEKRVISIVLWVDKSVLNAAAAAGFSVRWCDSGKVKQVYMLRQGWLFLGGSWMAWCWWVSRGVCASCSVCAVSVAAWLLFCCRAVSTASAVEVVSEMAGRVVAIKGTNTFEWALRRHQGYFGLVVFTLHSWLVFRVTARLPWSSKCVLLSIESVTASTSLISPMKINFSVRLSSKMARLSGKMALLLLLPVVALCCCLMNTIKPRRNWCVCSQFSKASHLWFSESMKSSRPLLGLRLSLLPTLKGKAMIRVDSLGPTWWTRPRLIVSQFALSKPTLLVPLNEKSLLAWWRLWAVKIASSLTCWPSGPRWLVSCITSLANEISIRRLEHVVGAFGITVIVWKQSRWLLFVSMRRQRTCSYYHDMDQNWHEIWGGFWNSFQITSSQCGSNQRLEVFIQWSWISESIGCGILTVLSAIR